MSDTTEIHALIIAGFDATSGAGVTADLAVAHSFCAHGCTVPSCIVVQDTSAVRSTSPVGIDVFRRQLELLVEDVEFDCVKVGALPTAEHVDVVTGVVRRLDVPTVVDPVLAGGTRGAASIYEGVREAWWSLLREATVCTPNLPELGALGASANPTELAAKHGATLLVTGGHGDEVAVDILYRPDGSVRRFEGSELEGAGHVHGTGCRLSTALALRLAYGDELPVAIEAARAYLRWSLIDRIHLPGRGRPAFDHRWSMSEQDA